MLHSILIENQRKRLDLPFHQLLCFVMFCIWQMGFIYFMGPSLTIDGKVSLPISMDNTTLLIVAAYAASILVMSILPQKITVLARVSAIGALLTAIAWFFPLPVFVLTILMYLHCFFCCFMIGFESATIIHHFSEKSAVKHLLAAYPIAYIAIVVLQNDIATLPFSLFRFLIVLMLLPLIYFYFKMPTDIPRFVKKSDGLPAPRRFLTGVYLLSFLCSLMGVVGPAVAAEVKHGVALSYLGCGLCALCMYALYLKTKQNPIHWISFVIIISVVGYLLLLFIDYFPAIAWLSCPLIGAGMTACSLVPLFGLLVSKEYPSRFIAPAIITIAMLAVIIHSAILEMFRNSVTLLNFCYLCIMVLTAMVFLLTEPYLIYAMKRRFVSAPAELPEEKTQESVNEIKAEASLLPLDSLTKRELEVAHLISSGYTNPDIAKMLFISEYTVKDHAKNIYRKLGVNGRRELIAKINRMDE